MFLSENLFLSDSEIKSGDNAIGEKVATLGASTQGILAEEFGEMIQQRKVVQYILRPKL